MITCLKLKGQKGYSITTDDLEALIRSFVSLSVENEFSVECPGELTSIIVNFVAQANLLPRAHAEYYLPDGRKITMNCET